MQVFYCDTCGTKVTESDLERGRAARFGAQTFCFKCKQTAPVSVAAPARKSSAGIPAVGSARKSSAGTPAVGASPRKSNPSLPAVSDAARKSNPRMPAVGDAVRKSNRNLTPVAAVGRKSNRNLTPVSEGARKSNAALPAVVVPEHGQGLSPADRLHRRADSTRQSHVGERAFPLGTVAGVIGVILLLIGLVLIFGRSRRGSTSNQPPAHTHEEKPPEEGPEPPPEKSNAPPPAEMAAITAWNKAEEFYRAQKWAEARDAYQAFQNSHGTTKEGKARADTVKARLATVLEALRPPCQLPDSWKGGNAGTTDNNPLLGDGKPRWRLDQIWPDDPLRPGSYKPMPWNGQAWQPRENTHGDQPQASLAGGRLEIANRTAWTDQPGDKLAALVFIAPSAGRYSLAGNVTPAVSDSGRPLALLILRRDPVASRVEQVASLPLQDKQRTAIKDATVMLDAGQELVILPAFTGTGLCACTFAFEGLKIEALPVK